jgi:hypothetical protein
MWDACVVLLTEMPAAAACTRRTRYTLLLLYG